MRILWQTETPMEEGPKISSPIAPSVVLPLKEQDNEDQAISDGDEEWMDDCEDDS